MNTNRKVLQAVLLTLLASCAICTVSAEPVHIAPGINDNFSKASFDLLVPKKVTSPEFIYVLVPGIDGDGEKLLTNPFFLEFAEKMNAALIACTFKSNDKNNPKYVPYSAAQHGSGAALESAIRQLAAKNPAYSLSDLPLLIRGFSAGGQFAYGFSCYNPRRIIGFAAIKGGYYYPDPMPETYKVPGLIISGRTDLPRRRAAVRKLFESHREKGALWCWMEDDAGHETNQQSESAVQLYLEGCVRLRLQTVASSKISPEHRGVTVDLFSKEILHEGVPLGEEVGNPRIGFLPSQDAWQAWSRTDTGSLKYSEQTE